MMKDRNCRWMKWIIAESTREAVADTTAMPFARSARRPAVAARLKVAARPAVHPARHTA